MRHGSYNGYGQLDGLITPTINLSGMENATLHFSYSYTPFYTSKDEFPLFYTDTLSAFVSEDCGNSWKLVYQKGGDDIRTTKFTGSLHIPSSANQWRKDSVNLKSFIPKGNIQIKIQTTNGNGNHLYIDDIGLRNTVFPASVMEIKPLSEMVSIHPNPFNQSTDLVLNFPQPQTISVKIMDCLGKKCWELAPQKTETGSISLPMESLSEGVYFAQIQVEDRVTTMKLVKSK